MNDNIDNNINLPYQYIKCINCHGYGTLGFKRVQCPTCKGKGVIRVDSLESEDSND